MGSLGCKCCCADDEERLHLREKHTIDAYQSIKESMDHQKRRRKDSVAWEEYKHMMQLIFYTFAGYQPWAKVKGLYMYRKDLGRFLEIVNIDEPVEEVFKLIDSDIMDGRITFNEWMDYFTNKHINPSVFEMREHIQGQISWELLVKSLNIFEKMDADHSGKLEYGEFRQFCELISLTEEETDLLFKIMDTNKSGSVDITELFEWFKMRVYQQRGRITSQKQATITLNEEDTV